MNLQQINRLVEYSFIMDCMDEMNRNKKTGCGNIRQKSQQKSYKLFDNPFPEKKESSLWLQM